MEYRKLPIDPVQMIAEYIASYLDKSIQQYDAKYRHLTNNTRVQDGNLH